MTELIKPTQLREMAARNCEGGGALPKARPVMSWAIDETTGRPVSQWMLAEPRPVSFLSDPN